MLTRRVVVCLDVQGGRVVKGTQFVNLRDVGDPVELATRYEREGADEIGVKPRPHQRRGLYRTRRTSLPCGPEWARSRSAPPGQLVSVTP